MQLSGIRRENLYSPLCGFDSDPRPSLEEGNALLWCLHLARNNRVHIATILFEQKTEYGERVRSSWILFSFHDSPACKVMIDSELQQLQLKNRVSDGFQLQRSRFLYEMDILGLLWTIHKYLYST